MGLITVGPAERLRVEQLEERCVLTGLPWPVASGDIVGILSSYGQFSNTGGIHFHEGLDIVVAADTWVHAIERGKVIGVRSVGDYFDRVSIVSSGGVGWNYLHMTPTLKVDDTIYPGQKIGKVVAPDPTWGYPTHLHIDAAGSKEPEDPTWLRPVNDPLALLDPSVIGRAYASKSSGKPCSSLSR